MFDFALLAFTFLMFIVGLWWLIFRKGRRIVGAWMMAMAPIVLTLGILYSIDAKAQKDGWADEADRWDAIAAGVKDPVEWEKRKADEAAALEAEKAREAEQARLYGHQCLSVWNGQHDGLVDAVTARLRDPDSFDHISTRTGLADAKGLHPIAMEYRAKNGFGGFTIGTAVGVLDGRDCSVTLYAVE